MSHLLACIAKKRDQDMNPQHRMGLASMLRCSLRSPERSDSPRDSVEPVTRLFLFIRPILRRKTTRCSRLMVASPFPTFPSDFILLVLTPLLSHLARCAPFVNLLRKKNVYFAGVFDVFPAETKIECKTLI